METIIRNKPIHDMVLARATERCRTQHGNILVLTTVTAWLTTIGLVVGMSISGLFLMHYRLQSQANELAALAAQVMNEKDREGQMNDTISHCRQLVFASREIYDSTAQTYPDFEPLARQLLDGATASAADLEAERKNLLKIATDEANQKVAESFRAMSERDKLTLPWLQTSSPTVVNVSVGYVDGVPSNVEILPTSEQATTLAVLKAHDQQNNFFAEKNHHYLPNINAKLPGQESHLDFNFSSLAPPVLGTVSPLHAMLPAAFRSDQPGQLPSAAQVTLSLDVATQIGASIHKTVKVVGCAAACGAEPVR